MMSESIGQLSFDDDVSSGDYQLIGNRNGILAGVEQVITALEDQQNTQPTTRQEKTANDNELTTIVEAPAEDEATTKVIAD